MKPILPGGRGAAVEDVQRRLLTLGYDLGPTGVDGVFFGRTRDAVTAFQREHHLAEDGVVGAETWAALVDATFILGDRMLYLRLPYFHGNDVRVLQEALNALGFSCGLADGIFGSFTERAVREFQRNGGLPADGIVGPDTVSALTGLRHVWEGKDARSPASATVAPARMAEVLARNSVALVGIDEVAEDVAVRVVNLALATYSQAGVMLAGQEWAHEAGIELVLSTTPFEDGPAVPVVSLGSAAGATEIARRLGVALAVADGERSVVRIELEGLGTDEHQRQRLATHLLDALCLALA